MRLLLHVGMNKTGTTAIQSVLASHVDTLAAAGVLYPEPWFHASNHAYLVPALKNPDHIPRAFLQNGRSRADVRAMSDEAWRQLAEEVGGSSAHTAVLSSEYLLGLQIEGVRELASRLSGLFAPIEFVAYVRAPGDQYVSVAQQRVRGTAAISSPASFRLGIRRRVQCFDEVFDAPFDLRRFRRSADAGGVVTDFLRLVLPAETVAAFAVHPDQANTSLSAEAMCVLQSRWSGPWWGGEDVFTPEVRETIAQLREIGQELGQSGPQMHPELVERLAVSHVNDLDFLRGRFGIVFPEMADLSTASRTGVDPAGWTSDQLRELLVVDDDAIEATAAALAQRRAGS